MSELSAAWRAAEAFALGSPVSAVTALGEGLINRTYEVATARGPRFVVQRLNEAVFSSPEPLMANIRKVTRHLARRGDRAALSLVETPDGASWHRGGDGGAWRCYRFVEHARAWSRVPDRATARRAAAAFGRFVADLADLPAAELHAVLPGFHDTPARLAALERAVVEDACGRAAGLQRELEQIRRRAAFAGLLERALHGGELPLRVVHNDTKLSNVLFHRDTNQVLCVVDLDTVMPGLLAHDFGDMVRSAATVGRGTELALDAALFEVLAEGYLQGLGPRLSAAEAHYLADAPAVLALELATRFLTDHLQGDRQFRIGRPNENLERARGRLALLASMERQRAALRQVLERVVRARTRTAR